jgi:hypothetical protein
MIRLNIGVLLLLFAASPIVVPIFFNIARAAGTTYYVDNCVTVGNNSNSGTSPSTPWLTVSKVNASTFSAGDTISFEKTCTWREQLVYPSSGSAGNPVTFNLYGTGAPPILSGSVLVTVGWSSQATNVWKATVSTQPNTVYFNGTLGTLVGSIGAVAAPFNWFWASNVLYVWSPPDSDPSLFYTSPGIEAGALNSSVVRTNDKSYVTFDGITVRDSNDKAHANIQAGAISSVGLTFQNCVIERGAGSGFNLFGSTTANTVTINNCIIQNNGAWGIAVENQYASGTISNNIITGNGLNSVQDNQEYSQIDGVLGNFNIFGNTVTNADPAGCKTGGSLGTFCHEIYYSTGFGGDLTQVANIYGNSISGSTFGVGIKVVGSANVYQNLVYGNDVGGIATGQNGTNNVVYQVYNNVLYNNNVGNVVATAGIFEQTQGAGTISLTVNGNTFYQNSGTNGYEVRVSDNIQIFTMKNNILFSTATRPTFETPVTLTGTLSIDYNDYHRADGTAALFWNNASITWAAWQALGFDAHGLNGIDPLFTNAAGNNLTLQTTSPAIDAGTTLGAPYNMALDPRSSFPWSTIDQGIYGSWEIGAFVYVPNYSGSGNQAAPRYDFLNNSATSATSNHTLVFTVQNSLDNTGGSASDTLALTFQSNFNLANITCGDVNVATGTRFLFNVASPEPRTNCPNTTTSWGLLVNTASRTITITVPASVKTYVATGTIITVSIGSNANFQNQGTHWIINPSDSGTKSITIGGTFGGYGQILVSVNTPLQLSATVAETLTLTLTGLAGSGTGGMNSCSSDGTHDAEDNASINLINTTAASVPFGTLSSSNTFYEGCQKVSITTNAGNGFTVAVREDHSLRTASGLAIADTGCDASGCLNTPSTAAAWVTNTNPGLGISCANAATSSSCWTANPNWVNGTKWAPLANEGENNPTGGTQTPAIFSGLTGATSVEVITKAKYRVTVPPLQPAGTYTNLVSFIATPVF